MVWDIGVADTFGIGLTATVAMPVKSPVMAVQLASEREVTE
jgi:hypothetical protein